MKSAKVNSRAKSIVTRLALALLTALALALPNFTSRVEASRERARLAATRAAIGPSQFQSQPYNLAISSKVITGYIRQVSEQAASPSDLRLTVIAKDLSNPRGLDHHAPSNKLAVSVSSSSDHPFGLQLVSADGSRTGFARLGNSVKIAAVRDKLGGFTPGELFAGSSAPGVIARVSADGSTVQNPWVTLPKETAVVDSLFIDRTGLFNGDLIAATSQGRVWRVDASRKPTLLASLDTRLEGVTVAPNDSTRYGDWAGKILVGDKQYGGIYTIDARGNSVFYRLAVTPKDIDIIPQHESLFAVDGKQGMIFSASAAQLAGIAGDLVIAQENPGVLWRLHWNSKEFEMSRLAQVDQLEQVAFSPVGSCATAISPTSAYCLSAGTEDSVAVTAPDGCAWTASSNVPWMVITSAASGTGNDTVTYIVRDNVTGVPRQGTLTIAGQTFTVTQDGGADNCVITLSEQSRSFPARSDTGSLNVFAEEGCSWQAVSNASWVTITSNCCGIGNGVVTYAVAANPTITGRAAKITVAGKSFSIKQKAHVPPVANAGLDQMIALPNSASLAGTVTDDGAGGAVSVSWSKVTGPETVIFGNASGTGSTAIFSKEGSYTLRLTATDSTGLTSSDDVVVTVNPDPVEPPPDPMTVAPPINNTVVTTIGSATSFLYSGPNPIQTGVAPGTINLVRVAVLRGRVLDKNGSPLVLVKITILNHPELGQTFSRADGKFDLAVNGGGLLTLKYEKLGFLPVQRQENVPWQDYVMIDDVVMMSYDPQVTRIDLSANIPMQVAQGTTMTDNAGTRRATLLFPQGTTATMKLPDGSMQGLTQLHVRATEYTVGANGPAAMPGDLPTTSAYTYAVDFTVDEAVAAGATTVLFSQPVINYLDNFLSFPVGTAVPSGVYDSQSGIWVPISNGLVVKILSIDSGQVNMDLSGSGQPATDDEYAAVGITTAERQRLALLYSAGQSLWRVSIPHFSSTDCNWAPGGAQFPNQQKAKKEDPKDCYNSAKCGCIIECDSLTLGETLNITGTPFTLNYRSSRVPGRLPALVIPLSGPSVPAPLTRIELRVMVAGRTFTQTFSTAPNQTYNFPWDGKDDYGRTLQGPQPTTVRIGYVYDGVPYFTPGGFGGVGILSLNGSTMRQEVTFQQEYRTLSPTYWNAQGGAIGGWMVNVHHTYDANSRLLYLGDGSQRGVNAINNVIATVAGGGAPADGLGDGGQASDAQLDLSANQAGSSVAIAPDGSYYIADSNHDRIRRVAPSGIITTVAGNGTAGYNGDGIQATLARLNKPGGVALAQDGSFYIADTNNQRIRKVAPNGIITTVAGNGSAGYSGDGGPATQAQLNTPIAITVGPDGTLFISDSFNIAVRRVGPDGIISTLLGGGPGSKPAVMINRPQVPFANSSHTAVGPNGSLYICDWPNGTILRLGTDGSLEVVAGGGFPPTGIGDGGPAVAASLFQPSGIAVLPDGGFYIADSGHNRVRFVSADGIINTVAGNGTGGFSGDGGSALQAQFGLSGLSSIAVAQDGSFYVMDSGNNRIRRIAPTLPGFTATSFAIPSADGSQLYQFDSAGRHLRTINTLTGANLYTFTYDSAGRLIQITDGNSNITTIERNASGAPTGIVAPFGQRTAFSGDANGFLNQITDPASQAYQFTYTSGGLMTSETDPRSNLHSFTYDSSGRLTRDDDPASGFKTLSRTVQSQALIATLTTALNRIDTYQTQDLSNGDTKRINTNPAGLQTQIVEGANGTDTTTSPDGMTDTATQSADPRWGMQASLPATLTSKTPANLLYTSTFARTVTLSDPNNVLSLTSQNDTSTINGSAYTNNYAAGTRTFTFTTPVGRQRTTVIDTQGRTTQSQFANLNSANFTYDTRGRLSTAESGAGAAARSFSFSYNTDGYLSSVTDPLSRTRSLVYDAAGRITQKTLPDGRTIAFAYDANGNLTSITPPGRPTHSFAYSPVDRRSSYTAPDVGVGNQTTYAYNLDRQLTTVTRPDSQTLNLAYDSGARLSTLTIPGGVYTFAYNATTGKLSSIIAPGGGTLSYTYDGALLTRSTWAGTIAGNVSRTFDNNFRVTSQSINSGNTVNFTYDNDSLLTGAGSLSLTRNAQNGLISGTTLGNVTDARSYSGFAEVTNYSASYNAASIYSDAYTYDKLSRITQKAETIGGVTDTLDYSYDLAGRLQEVKKNTVVIATYTYDSNSNRQSFIGPGGTVNGTYDDQDRLTGYGTATYAYTANGELVGKTVSSQVTTYQYDVVGNLKSVTLPNTTQIDYLIDGQDRRIGKKVNGIFVQGFLYQNQINPVAELDGSNNIVSRFVYGSRSNVPEYMIKSGVTYRIISDHLGSPRLVVDVATGNVAERIDYDEFGNITQDTNPGFQPFGFAGGLYDRDTGLVRFGARDYDAVTGRWTTKDPILFTAGDTNLYGYVLNDPINLTDAEGLCDKPTDPNKLREKIDDLRARAGRAAELGAEYATFGEHLDYIDLLVGGDGVSRSEAISEALQKLATKYDKEADCLEGKVNPNKDEIFRFGDRYSITFDGSLGSLIPDPNYRGF